MDFSDPEKVKSIIISRVSFFIIYLIIYKVLRRKINISPEYEIRMLTFIHGIFCTFCSFYYVILPAGLGFYTGA